MASQLDRVLQSIDAGLQSSLEHGYGTDRAPELCARCQDNPPASTSKDLCEGCRSWLLGDVDVDPAEHGIVRREVSGSPAFRAELHSSGFVVINETRELFQAAERLSVALSADIAGVADALQSMANAFAVAASATVEITTAYAAAGETHRYELHSWSHTAAEVAVCVEMWQH